MTAHNAFVRICTNRALAGMPIIEKLQKRFGFPKPTVVADAGLLSKEDIKDLEMGGYEYILGAKIRSQSDQFRGKVAALGLGNGESACISH